MSKLKLKKADKVTRINAENHSRLKAIVKSSGKGSTINSVLNAILDAAERFNESEVMYATKLYSDLADARGEAIMQAVRAKEVPTMPYIVTVLGADNG